MFSFSSIFPIGTGIRSMCGAREGGVLMTRREFTGAIVGAACAAFPSVVAQTGPVIDQNPIRRRGSAVWMPRAHLLASLCSRQ